MFSRLRNLPVHNCSQRNELSEDSLRSSMVLELPHQLFISDMTTTNSAEITLVTILSNHRRPYVFKQVRD